MLTLSASALTLSNEYVNVKIDTPADISQFNGDTLVNAFYFIGKAKLPTTTFDVKYEVILTKKAADAGCVLAAPVPATDTKNTAGGLVVSYTVERKVKGENEIEGNIYFLPVEIKVNETAKEVDDFVAVSKGTDEDLATDFAVKLNGTDGVTAELKVKAEEGDIKFKDEELTLESGKEVKTKLWGITPSSDRDKTIIEVTLKKDYKELGKIGEDATVFEGVKIKFEGNFYSNVDTREWNRLPWDGRKDPKPSTSGDLTKKFQYMESEIGVKPTDAEKLEEYNKIKAAYSKAVDQSLAFGYDSAISFKKGDNDAIKLYKPWIDDLEVKVSSVRSITPDLKMEGDVLNESHLEMLQGHFKGPDRNEEIVEPIFKVGTYFKLNKTTKKTTIKEVSQKTSVFTDDEFDAQLKDAVGKASNKELFQYYEGDWNAKQKEFRYFWWKLLSAFEFQWENKTFAVEKVMLGDSVAAKAVAASSEKEMKVEVFFHMKDWNEFKFQGSVNKGKIEAK